MKTPFHLLLCGFLIPLLAVSTSCSPKKGTIRLLSYNVCNCRGLDDSVSYQRVADVILESGAEYVALQELDSMTGRYPGVDVLRNLASLTGMHPVFAPSIDYLGGRYGIGMLSREKPLGHFRVPLPCRSEPRSLLVVEFKDFYYCSTHLSLHSQDRVQDARIINETLERILHKPVVLAGDLNAQPREEAMDTLSTRFEILHKQGTGWSWPSDAPRKEIDYFCVLRSSASRDMEILEHRVIESGPASDHRAILAVLRF